MTEILSGTKFKCAFCGGTGVQPRSLKSRCFPCRGKGEVKFDGQAITCPSCKGKGRTTGALGLACIRCKGVGVIEKGKVADTLGERLGEIATRLSLAGKETEKKSKEIEKRLKPIKPFISARGGSAFGGKEVKKETLWFEKLVKKITKGWKSASEK